MPVDHDMPVPSALTFVSAFAVGLRDAGRHPLHTSDPDVRAGLARVRDHFARLLGETPPHAPERHFLRVAEAAFRPGPTESYPGLVALLARAADASVSDARPRAAAARGHARTAMRVFLTPPLAVEPEGVAPGMAPDVSLHLPEGVPPPVEVPPPLMPVTSNLVTVAVEPREDLAPTDAPSPTDLGKMAVLAMVRRLSGMPAT